MGKVFSGIGEGKKFVGFDWVSVQIEEKFGFVPYKGTLNLKIDSKNLSEYHQFIDSRKGVEIKPRNQEFCFGKGFKVTLKNNIDGVLIIPMVPDYPDDQLEIIAPIRLRESLELKDGSEVNVEIFS
jgi:riboflavin kinase